MRRLIATVLVVAAASQGAAGAAVARDADPLGAPTVTAMTRNLFLGTGLEPLLGVTSPTGVITAIAQLWANVQATSFPQRADALADEIAAARPDVIGLQEAVLWRSQSPSDFTATPATTVVYDFLETLLAELAERGLGYRAVVVATNADLEFPVFISGIDVRLTDRDAILVRDGLPVSNPEVHPFAAVLSVGNVAGSITLPRSWQSVDVEVGGHVVRVANTHLEVADAGVQVAQATELLAGLVGSPDPLVLLGDFNSKADRTGTPTYGLIADAGYTDAWSALRPGEPGLTCCHTTDLVNPAPTLDERIDVVFARGLEPLSVDVVGDEPGDRTPGGLWPSDHAGVVATFGLPVVDDAVDAELRTVKVTRKRVVRATLALDEPVTLHAELRRKGKVLAVKHVSELAAGVRRVAIRVPRSVGGGRAQLRLELEDGAGNELVLTRRVKLSTAA